MCAVVDPRSLFRKPETPKLPSPPPPAPPPPAETASQAQQSEQQASQRSGAARGTSQLRIRLRGGLNVPQ